MTDSLESSPPKSRIPIAASLGLALAAALALLTMPLRWEVYLHDALIYLEGAWRIERGMRIHTDFHTPVGPVYFSAVDLGLRVFPFSPRAFCVAALASLLLVWPSAWFVCRRRFSDLWTVLVTAFLTALIVAPSCLGDPVVHHWPERLGLTFGMQYNRLFWAVACVVLLACLVRPLREDSRRSRTVEAAIVGIGAALLCWGKINFFIALLPILGIALYLAKNRGLLLVSSAAGFLLVSVGYVLYGASPMAYLADVAHLAKGQNPIALIQASRGVFIGNLWTIAPVLASALVGFAYVHRTCLIPALAVGVASVTALGLRSPAAWALAVISAGLGLILDRRFRFAWAETKWTWSAFDAALLLPLYASLVASANYQSDMLPPVFLAAILVAVGVSQIAPGASVVKSAAALAAAFIAIPVGLDVAAILKPFLTPTLSSVTASSKSPVLQRLLIAPGTEAEATYQTQEGEVELADDLLSRQARVGTVQWIDVVPVLTGRPSPKGLLWFQPDRTVTNATMPSPDSQFDTADAVFMPIHPTGVDQFEWQAYHAYVESHYRMLREQGGLRLYVRDAALANR